MLQTHRLTAFLYKMELSDINSNQIETVLAFKKTLVSEAGIANLTDSLSQETRKINGYGEVEARKVKQEQKRLTDEEIALLCDAYQNGKSTYQLAREFGCHRNTVSNALKSRGIEVTNKVKLDVEAVIEMYAQKHNAQEIADRFGIGSQIVLRCLKAHGVKIRGRWEY